MPPKIYLKLLNKILLTQETKLDIINLFCEGRIIMAKITSESISGINDVNKLLDFLSLNMFEEENNDIMEDDNIPEFIKNVMYIILFETDYEMEGLWTIYSNHNNNFDNFIKSFYETGNNGIANCIKEIIGLYNIKNRNIERENELNELENRLRGIIEEKVFWNTIIEYIKFNIELGL
jgi:hypothetical protein